MRWTKARSVASFEFLSTVTRKGYLIATFGMPIFVLLYGALVSIPAYFAATTEPDVTVFGVVDEADVLKLDADVTRSPIELPPAVRQALEASGQDLSQMVLPAFGATVFRPVASRAAAAVALTERKLSGYYVLPADYLESGVVAWYTARRPGTPRELPMGSLVRILRDRLIEGIVEDDIAARVRTPISETTRWTVGADGQVTEGGRGAELARLGIPIAFALLLFISVMMSAGYLIQSTAVEKENKVVEVLLSSADPDEILAGKLLGLGGAALLQMTVWFGMVFVAGLLFAGALAAFGVDIPWGIIGLGLAFFVVAYFFLGSLMLGTGSLGNNVKESQQMSMVWSLLAALPMMFLPLFMSDPHGPVALVLTWVPFTAPIVVVLRMALEPEGIAWWEVAGAWLVMVGATWLAIRIGARLFRVGLLLTGVRPSFREILRQARLGH